MPKKIYGLTEQQHSQLLQKLDKLFVELHPSGGAKSDVFIMRTLLQNAFAIDPDNFPRTSIPADAEKLTPERFQEILGPVSLNGTISFNYDTMTWNHDSWGKYPLLTPSVEIMYRLGLRINNILKQRDKSIAAVITMMVDRNQYRGCGGVIENPKIYSDRPASAMAIAVRGADGKLENVDTKTAYVGGAQWPSDQIFAYHGVDALVLDYESYSKFRDAVLKPHLASNVRG